MHNLRGGFLATQIQVTPPFSASQEEEEGEYRIKTVENFDFEAARRAGQEAAEREAREKAEEEARAAQPAPEPERVKIVEDFDFEAARQQAAQQQPQEETVPHAAKPTRLPPAHFFPRLQKLQFE